MAKFSNGEFCSEIQAPKCVLQDREIEDLIHFAGLKIDEDVTRHVVSLLRYGVRPMSIYTMLQSLAKECNDPMKSGKEERGTPFKKDDGGNSYQRDKAKPLKAKTLKK